MPKWVRKIIEDGGVATEDMAAADLDGDGKIDIVAVGRKTKNVPHLLEPGREEVTGLPLAA